MLKQFLILAGFSVLGPPMLWTRPTGYLFFSLFILTLSLIVLVKPMPRYHLGSRVFAILWLFLAALPGITFSTSMSIAAQEAHLAELRINDPAGYLSAIEHTDPNLWFRELRALDPARYDIEVAERTVEAQRRSEERVAEADRLTRHQCSDAYASQAYIYVQFFC